MNRLKYPRLLMASTGTLLAWIIIYQLSIAPTFDLQNEIDKTESELLQLQKDLREQASYSDALTSSSLKSNEDFQTQLLAFLEDLISDQAVVIKLIEAETFTKGNGFDVITQPIVLEGSYFGLLSTLNQLEQSEYGFQVASSNFFTVLNKRTKKEKLYLKLYVQGIG